MFIVFAMRNLLFAIVLVSGCKLVEREVARDAVKGYELAVKGRDAVEICVHAGLVVAAYNQAQDEQNYLKWKDIEERDCNRAGIQSDRR